MTTAKSVAGGFFDLAGVSTIRADPVKADSLRLESGDVLFNEGRDRDKLGRGWVWEGQIDRCIHQNHVFRARLKDSNFDRFFVSSHANSGGKTWFERHGKQTTNLASINMGTLRQFPVPAPGVKEQRAIIAGPIRVNEARDRLAEVLKAASRRSAALRPLILSAALAGKLVPHCPDDEPASELLNRIWAKLTAAKPRRRASAVKA